MKLIITYFFLALNMFTMHVAKDEGKETVNSYYTSFKQETVSIYDSYYEWKNVKDDNAMFSIILGIHDNNFYYDVFYYEKNGLTKQVRVEIGEDEYLLPVNENDYYSCHGIQNDKNNTVKVFLFNGQAKLGLTELPKDYNEFDTFESGLGNGPVITYLDPIAKANKPLITIILVSLIVIFGSLIGIGILYVFKVGKFKVKPAKLEKDYRSQTYQENSFEIGVVTDEDPVINKTMDVKQIESSDASISNRNDDSISDESDDMNKEVDIESLLLMKGYKTDYSSMTEEEKNEVMVYFMVLRKTNQLSFDQYQKEVVKLWKK